MTLKASLYFPRSQSHEDIGDENVAPSCMHVLQKQNQHTVSGRAVWSVITTPLGKTTEADKRV